MTAVRSALAGGALLLGSIGWGAPARVAVVTDPGGPDAAAVIRAVREAAGIATEVKVLRLPEEGMVDPIAKGRLLASLQAVDLVVTVADRATAFVLNEREDVPVYFVGAASMVRGGSLNARGVAGILPYNIGQSLDLVQALGLAPLGLAYTAGYAGVAALVEAGAASRGIKTVRRSIDVRGDVGPVVRDLTRETRIVWVLGDPLLNRGAGFQFLIEQSLATHVPVVAPARWEVEHGALVGSDPDWTALATQAGAGLRERFAAGSTLSEDRIVPAAANGTLLVNRTLIAEWGMTMPSGTAWKGIR